MPIRRALAALCIAAAGPAMADAPRVAADIRPVHSLVAAVMEGVGAPDLLLGTGGSPHGGALRPSEAGALQAADLVVWVGPELTPWLARPVATLAEEARVLDLLDMPETEVLAARTDAAFADTHAGYDHDSDAHEEHGQDDHGHDEHAHEDHGADDHAHAAHHDDGHGHGHAAGGPDPHAWLDPRNAAAWAGPIAEALAAADPASAARYRANAAALRDRLAALDAALAETLGPVSDRPFAVIHDAFHYLEARYGLTAAGALSLSDASAPGPARMAELRETLASGGVQCLVVEPNTNADLVAALRSAGPVEVVTLDLLGLSLPTGPDLYAATLRAMARDLAACLG